MFPQMLLALLTDDSARVLLVRRKDSLLWTLPGSVTRGSVTSRPTFLAVCCSRQVGVMPDFVAPLTEFAFAGQRVALGVDQIPAPRARACGRVAESRWFQPEALPVDLAPIARLAITMFGLPATEMPDPVELALAG